MREFIIIMGAGFYRPKDNCISIGGVQTYIYDIAQLAISLGFRCVVYEVSCTYNSNIYHYNGIEIRNIVGKSNIFKCRMQYCFDAIYKIHNNPNNIFLIATDQLNINCKRSNTIAIQHGIAFDIPIYKWYGGFVKLLKCIRNVRRGMAAQNVVCVDYNFYNWFRTLYTIRPDHKVRVIPNYTQGYITEEALEIKLKTSKRNKIIFARRFVEYRGTNMFINVAKLLLSEFRDIEITFAGDGPLKNIICESFKNDNRVNVTSFTPNESVQFHAKYDIAIIPTIYSEGTSLSLCEAMSAGCFPIATHVGGLTNILLDDYNGVLIYPEEQDLYFAIKDAMTCTNDRYNMICNNAYNTAKNGFSKEKWESKWTKFINELK